MVGSSKRSEKRNAAQNYNNTIIQSINFILRSQAASDQQDQVQVDQSNAVPGTTAMQVSVVPPRGRCRRVIGSWDRHERLGSGSFGTVYKGINEMVGPSKRSKKRNAAPNSYNPNVGSIINGLFRRSQAASHQQDQVQVDQSNAVANDPPTANEDMQGDQATPMCSGSPVCDQTMAGPSSPAPHVNSTDIPIPISAFHCFPEHTMEVIPNSSPSTPTALEQMQAMSTPSSSAPKEDVNDVMVSSLPSDFAQMQLGHSGSGPSASTLGDTTVITDPTTLEHKSSKKRAQKIGQGKAFGTVCDFLTRSDVGKVGIYGMGGVGKTTLMTKVCNEFLIPYDYKVIRIAVSRTFNVDDIQMSLMDELKLKFHEKQDPQARGMKINEALSKLFNSEAKVALLLDDIWESLDLEELGVAGGRGLDTSKFKIIFTTRLEDVCLQMDPDQKMKIECLGPEESWALFKQSVGEKALHSHCRIPGLAKEVAKKFGGLPLALTVIGKAMVSKTSLEAWEDALDSLESLSSPVSGVEEKLFKILKFSYDNLQNQVERECFLFCCMYPEDQKIDKNKLVESWIGGGLLDVGYGTYQKAWNRGHGIIDTLVAKSLLEGMGCDYPTKVKMHDVIREMGLSIDSKSGLLIDSKSNYFVHTDSLKINREEIAKRWNGARHVYVEGYNDVLPQELVCPNLSSLHIYGRRIKISNTFLNSMKFMCKIKVLIIDDVQFECPEIPTSTFGLLAELRHLEIKRSNMRALTPDIGNLTKLLVLILIDNDILTTLPPTIGGLCELRNLQISNFHDRLMNIPSELGKLKKLEIVDICMCGELKMDNILNQCAELRKLHLELSCPTPLLNDLYNLKKLEELHIEFDGLNWVDTLWKEGLRGLTSLKVLTMDGWRIVDGDEVIYAIGAMRQLRELRIIKCNNIDKLVIPAASDNFLPQLEVLEIQYCNRLEKVHFRKRTLQSLCILEIGSCPYLAHVVGLQHLLQLRELEIVHLWEIKEKLITTDVDEHCSPSDVQTHPVCFPYLQRLRLRSLRSMKRMCDDIVSFPSLSEFRLINCPHLEKLPRGLMNENRTTPMISGIIVGKKEWWEGLEWELDDAFKSYLHPLFVDERDRLSLLSEVERRVKLSEDYQRKIREKMAEEVQVDQSNAVPGTTTMQVFVVSPRGRCRRVIGSWERGQLLGSGSFGTVYEGISDDGFFFAVKEVSLVDQDAEGQQCIDQLEQEIALLSQFEHENIVQYLGTGKEETKLYIFLELVTQGSLASLYKKYRLRDSQVSAYTRQILGGLKYLHDRNVIHRDIKCANILVDASGLVKLADFGLAKEISKLNPHKSRKGSAFWMAPEVVNPRKTYNLAADIWSLGCTVLEMLTRELPYANLEWAQAVFKIGRGELPNIPESLSPDARNFIKQCIIVDPDDRPSAAELLNHPFVRRQLPASDEACL